MNRKAIGLVLGVMLTPAFISGCAGQPTLEVTTEPPAASAPAPTSSAAAGEAESTVQRGTRANPLAVGESRKISDQSMWIVGAERATEVGDGYLVLPLRVSLDWDAARKQAESTGGGTESIDEQGVDPVSSLIITFVSASGRSYSTLDNFSVDIPGEELWEIGTVFPPAQSFSASHAVSVPKDEVAGGVWQIQNGAGESVFIAQ